MTDHSKPDVPEPESNDPGFSARKGVEDDHGKPVGLTNLAMGQHPRDAVEDARRGGPMQEEPVLSRNREQGEFEARQPKRSAELGEPLTHADDPADRAQDKRQGQDEQPDEIDPHSDGRVPEGVEQPPQGAGRPPEEEEVLPEYGRAGAEGVGALDAARDGREGTDQDRERPGRNGEPGREAGGEGYEPNEEAEHAGQEAAELLKEARDEIKAVTSEHGTEVGQTAGLADSIDRLAVAVDALSRTVQALVAELKARRNGGSLPVVATVQESVADSSAAEAESVAHDGPVKEILRTIMRKLKLTREWLWSMIINLATIREWSLGGKVKVPGLAEASLTVTFGG